MTPDEMRALAEENARWEKNADIQMERAIKAEAEVALHIARAHGANMEVVRLREALEQADARIADLEWRLYGNAGRGKPKPGGGAGASTPSRYIIGVRQR